MFRFVILLLFPALAWSAQTLQILDAYVRATAPGQANGAAYMVLHNDSEQALVVSGASSDLAERVEFHTTTEEGGLLRMRRVDVLEMEPGARVTMAPGGMHLMLHGLRRALQPGEQIQLCLQLQERGAVCQDVEVISLSAAHAVHH